MSAPLSMGPMLVMENGNNPSGASTTSTGPIYHHHHHQMHPGPPPPPVPAAANNPAAAAAVNINSGHQHHPQQQHQHQLANNPAVGQTMQSLQTQPMMPSSSMNRSQRCGVCRGCQCKPCGQCTYCQDSPQFGGPGVKKQSCIERRCLRVLENRLQRDAPTFKARVGCNQCEDCRMPDCQICLVCLDRRFFDNRYMTGAMCAKKRCNNATSIELPAAQNTDLRQAHKRSYEHSPGLAEYQMMKRRLASGMEQLVASQPPGHLNSMASPPPSMVYPGGGSIAASIAQQQQPQICILQTQLSPPQSHTSHQQQHLLMTQQQQHQIVGPIVSSISSNGGAIVANGVVTSTSHQRVPPTQQQQQPQQHFMLQYPYVVNGGTMVGQFGQAAYLTESQVNHHNHHDNYEQSDPFTPPSYAPEMKNAVVLQPL